MFCVYCGKKNLPEARFCFNCGKPMQTLAANAGQQPTSGFPPSNLPTVNPSLPTAVPNSAANSSSADPFGLSDLLLPFSYQPSNTSNPQSVSPTNKPLDLSPTTPPVIPNPAVNAPLNPVSNVSNNPMPTQIPTANPFVNVPINTPLTQGVNPPPVQPTSQPTGTFSSQMINAPTTPTPPVMPLGYQPPLTNPNPNYYQPPLPPQQPNYPNYPPMPFPAQQPNNYYNGNTYGRPPVATYNPYVAPATPEKITQLHPLLKGAIALPYEFYLHPDEWYSFVSPENRVSFVKLAGLGQRISAMLIDAFILVICNAVLLFALGISMAPQIGRGGNSAGGVDVPIWYWIMAYAVNLGYLGIGTRLGHTLGKRAVHIQVRLLDGSKPSWFLALLRSFSGYLLSASVGVISFIVIDLLSVILFGSNTSNSSSLILLGLLLLVAGSSLGYLWPLWDKQKQTWHDKLVRSIVTENTVWVEGINFGLPPRQPVQSRNVFTPTPTTSFNSTQNPFVQ